jgi:hypothetical protein
MSSTRNLVATALAGICILVGPSAALAAGIPSSSPNASAAATAPALSALTLNATDIVGGSPVTGTVKLSSAAAAGGFAIALSSDNTTAATVQASVTVPAGATSAQFVVSTLPVPNPQSALIIGTSGTTTVYSIITVRTQAQFSTGSISIVPGGNGSGTITSQPAGISCNISSNTTGVCSAFFPAGTVVKLTARAAAGSSFQGFRGTPGCSDPSKITVARGTTITCQPGFSLK